ncbi:hypothetical protein I2750_12205 [Bacillus sp. PR5]|nr:hypothetical protein [Bacillus sp. PR5]
MKKLIIIFITILLSFSPMAIASSDEDMKEITATILNLNGHLCAKVVSITPLDIKDQYEVICTEYRGGTGTVRYILNGRTGVAFKAG